jgi:hypothetical protein
MADLFENDRNYVLGDPELDLFGSREKLAQWRHRNVGPAYFKLGRKIIYRGGDLNAWAERQWRDPSILLGCCRRRLNFQRQLCPLIASSPSDRFCGRSEWRVRRVAAGTPRGAGRASQLDRLIGTRQADFIRASGHMHRAHRPDK